MKADNGTDMRMLQVKTTERGFTLMEAMIVLVVIGAAMAIAVQMMSTSSKAQARANMIAAQANEMATITRALNEYVTSAPGLPATAGGVATVSLANIITAGRLPARFAERAASGKTTPVSPLGQDYVAIVRRKTSGGYEGVVTVSGTPNAGFLARANVQNTVTAVREWNVAVMQKVREVHDLPAAVVKAGETGTDASVTGFQLDLAAFLGSAATLDSVALFSNFDQLSNNIGQGATAAETTPTECYQATSTTTDLTCAAGYTVKWKYTACSDPAAVSGRVYNTPIGQYRVTTATSRTAINFGYSNATELVQEGSPTWIGSAVDFQSQTASDCPGLTLRNDRWTLSASSGASTVTYNVSSKYCQSDGIMYDNYGSRRTTISRGSTNHSIAPNFFSPPGNWNSPRLTIYRVPTGYGFTGSPSGAATSYTIYATEGTLMANLNLGSLSTWGVYGIFENSSRTGAFNYSGGGATPTNAYHIPMDTPENSSTGNWTYVGSREPCAGSVNADPIHMFSRTFDSGRQVIAQSVDPTIPSSAVSGTETIVVPSGLGSNINVTCASKTLTNAATSGVTTNACPSFALHGGGSQRGLVAARSAATTTTVGVCCK